MGRGQQESHCSVLETRNSWWGSESPSVMSDSLRPHGQYRPWNSPGQNTGIPSLLQGIFPTQGSNPGTPHCRQILYQLSHQGSPGILEWVAFTFLQGIFPGIKPSSPVLQASSLLIELSGKLGTQGKGGSRKGKVSLLHFQRSSSSMGYHHE